MNLCPFYVYKIISDDGGLTWSKPAVIASMDQPPNVVSVHLKLAELDTMASE